LHNIPTELTSFIGREREIAQVKAFLFRTRLLTLIGAGGAGKSRLAIRVAAEVLANFPDGVWLAELASLADPALVPQRVASALNVPEQPGRGVAEQLLEALRFKSPLLLLDNCEHVASACAALASGLLHGCPGLRIVATSRVPLSVPGETLWRVPSLALPDPGGGSSVEEVGRSEAVRLFLDRARASEPAFALARHNAEAVGQVCRRLDGMPLAIELAAARTNVLSAEQIASRLDDRFRLLTGGSSAALPRHQTLRATMDWSYGLLAERERTLLRRLSVFAGGWTLEAAEAVCAGEEIEPADVLDALSRLVDGTLVITVTPHGAARYRLLETVRQYARDRLLETGEAARVGRRHLEWYLSFAEEADRGLRGPHEPLWLGRMETEHDNLLAALDFARADPAGGQAEVRLAGALEWFWHVAGHWTEGRARLEAVLGRAGGSRSLLPKVIVGAARLAYRQGDRQRVRMLCDEGLMLSRRVADRLGEACCLLWLGILAMVEGDAERPMPLIEESLAIYRALGDRWWTVEALSFLGGLAVMRGDYPRARALHEESLAVARETANLNNVTTALRNLGHLALRRGDDDQAAAYYTESLRLCTGTEASAVVDSHERPEVGTTVPSALLLPGVITECLDGLARVACARGAYEQAARLFGATEASLENLGGQLPFWSDVAEHDRYVEAARAALGDARFAAAREQGRAMTLEQGADYALAVTAGTLPHTRAQGPAGGTRSSPLTTREQEVAALVARGLTNREIAAALVVTERTAETHVQNILNKLGFGSRAQVAAWAVEQGLKKAGT
jgi:predicted ATPase/DNA-binding CsgD family transcriptional regulator